MIGRLKSGELEIAIGALPQPEADLDVVPFVRDHLIVVTLKEWPLARKHSVPWRALADYPIVAPSKESSTRDLIEPTYAQATGKRFAPMFEAAYWLTVVSMIEAGLGVAVAPSHAITSLSTKKVRVIPLTQPTVNRDINLITHRERMLSPAARAFMAHLLGNR